MPLIPTYRAGVGAPQLADAYLGARRIAQEAASDAARILLGREELAQRAVANEMELTAKRDLLNQQAMKIAHEQEIDRAYKETQIGLSKRALDRQEEVADWNIKKAARDFANEQTRTRRIKELTPTHGLEEAVRIASLESGSTTTLDRSPDRRYSAVAGVDPLGLNPPSRLSMTAPEFQSFMLNAPPELKTNSVNVSIERMLQPPAGVGTNTTATATGTNIFNTAEEVRAAFRANRITRDEAKRILSNRFGMK